MTERYNRAIHHISSSSGTFYKFISANDLGLTGGHQKGYYISKPAAKLLFDCDSIKGTTEEKLVHIDWGDGIETDSHFKYYGQHTRDESRLTTFGRGFEYLKPNYLGSLMLVCRNDIDHYSCSVLDTEEEIEDICARFNIPSNSNCGILEQVEESPDDILSRYLIDTISSLMDFPDTHKMSAIARDGVNNAYKRISAITNPDSALLKWVDTEYKLFRLLEEKLYQPIFSKPFKSCQELIDISNEILNRRKSRAGKSLEHHLSFVFSDWKLDFEEQCITEDRKKPDFIFPNGEAYHNLVFPAEDLTVLGAKTTCKDRWRQVLNEADRIDNKYLFTLQQGVSSSQIDEMRHENLTLVIPKDNFSYFAKRDREYIISLVDFINLVQEKQSHHPKYYLFQ